MQFHTSTDSDYYTTRGYRRAKRTAWTSVYVDSRLAVAPQIQKGSV